MLFLLFVRLHKTFCYNSLLNDRGFLMCNFWQMILYMGIISTIGTKLIRTSCWLEAFTRKGQYHFAETTDLRPGL